MDQATLLLCPNGFIEEIEVMKVWIQTGHDELNQADHLKQIDEAEEKQPFLAAFSRICPPTPSRAFPKQTSAADTPRQPWGEPR
jgi:hypothetical protein